MVAKQPDLPPIPPNAKSVSLPWFHDRAHYNHCKQALAKHSSMLPYDDWLDRTQQAVQQLRDQGVVVNLIEFDLKAFLSWCKANKIKPDAQARAGYVSIVAGERDARGNPDAVH